MEKKNKKKKPWITIEKGEKIPPTKAVTIGKWISVGVFLFSLVYIFIGAFIPALSTFMWRVFGNLLSYLRYMPSQHIILKIGPVRAGMYYYLLLAFILLGISSAVVSNQKKLPKKKRHHIYNVINCITYYLIVFIVILGLSFSLFPENHVKLDTLFFKDQVDNTYTVDDLYNLHHYLEEKVIEYAHKMNRDSEGNLIHGSLEKQSIADLKKASKNYWVLRGSYPSTIYHFDDYDVSHDPSTLGLTTVDSVGVSFEESPVILANTITHEYCHTKGIMKENEATFCSVIVGLESDSELSQYAAYFEAYSRISNAIYLIDYDRYVESNGKIQNLCLSNHYNDICQTSYKLNRLYVHKSDMISISTYYLSLYDIQELKEAIQEFEPYNLKFYIGDKKITYDQIDSYKDQNVMLRFEFKNSKKIFKEVQPLLKEYENYFYEIFQEYPNMYEGVDMEKEEAIEYYTSSIPSSNILDLFTGDIDEYMEASDYSRVVRFILEYFDEKNISYS